MSSSSLNGIQNIQPNTLDGLLDIFASSVYIDGVPVVTGIDTAISPLVISGTNNNIISIPQANATTNGYLSSTDWNTFNAGSVDILPLNNSWSGTNTFNNDVTINCNGTGLTGSPKLLLSLPNFKTEVDDINNLYRIVETGANKAFYLSRLDNQKYSHYPLNVNDNDYTFTLSTTEYLDGCYIYSGVYLTGDRTISLPINTQFSTVYGTNYTCSFTILTAISTLNNFRWKINKTTTSTNTTMYVNQVLQTSYPFFLSLNTPYICEVEAFLSGPTQILIYNFRSLEKAQVIPNLQQVLTSGNTATSTNLDLTNGILLSSQVDTNVLASNTLTTIDVLNDLYLFPSIALKYYGEVLIKRLTTNIITTTSSGTILNLLPSKVALSTIPSSTKTNILYYDSTTKEISYGQPNIGQSVYGDGADGAVSFDNVSQYSFSSFDGFDTYTLIRDVWATTVFVGASTTVITGGYRLFAQTSINNAGSINNDGYQGVGTVGGLGGLGGFFKAGGNGASGLGTLVAGSNGIAQATPTADTWVGGLGGKGGQARASNITFTGGMITTANLDLSVPSNADGGSKVTSNFVNYMTRYIVGATNWQMTPSIGGGGGAKSAIGVGASSGAGGGGGGVCFVASPIISGSGSITAYGGSGVSASGTGGNFGGGGGGSGGICAIICRSITNTYSAIGASGGGSIETGTGAYPVTIANGTNTTLTATLTLNPTQALSKDKLYMLTFHLQKAGGIGASGINSVTGYGMTWTLISGSRVEYNSAVPIPYVPTRVQETWYGYYQTVKPDLIENRNITIQLSDINTTARVIIDEITNITADAINNPFTGNIATNSSVASTSLTVTLPNPVTAGNLVYSVFTRSGGTAPVAGANNTLVNNITTAPLMVSEVNTTGQQANSMSHTTNASMAGFSVVILQTIYGVNEGSRGWDGKVVRIYG